MSSTQVTAPLRDPAASSPPVVSTPTRPRRRTPASALGVAGLVVFLGVWELLPRTGLVDGRFLPPFTTVARTLGAQLGDLVFWEAFGNTVRGWAIGLLVATVAGVVGGIVIGSVPVLRALTSSTIEFLRPIPSVALIPLVVLVYGTDMRSTLLLVVYASLWQVLVQVLYGVQDVDPVASETARSYRFSRLTQVRTVIWPTALPYVMTGLRLAAAVALILEVTGELIIGSPGLGKSIAVAQSSGAVPNVYALVVVTGLFGVLVNAGFRVLEGRVLRWHPSIRGETPV